MADKLAEYRRRGQGSEQLLEALGGCQEPVREGVGLLLYAAP